MFFLRHLGHSLFAFALFVCAAKVGSFSIYANASLFFREQISLTLGFRVVHGALPVETAVGFDFERLGRDVSCNGSCCLEDELLCDFQGTLHFAMNFGIAGYDVPDDFPLWTDDDFAVARNIAFHLPVETEVRVCLDIPDDHRTCCQGIMQPVAMCFFFLANVFLCFKIRLQRYGDSGEKSNMRTLNI